MKCERCAPYIKPRWDCPDCGGTGVSHCCEGLMEQPIVFSHPGQECKFYLNRNEAKVLGPELEKDGWSHEQEG